MAEVAGARRGRERGLEQGSRREGLQQVEMALARLVDPGEQAVDDARDPPYHPRMMVKVLVHSYATGRPSWS